MPKRRSVILGLGALGFGSGAVTTMGAFSGDFSQPDADFRVIADAQLRVRSARDGSNNPIVASENPATEFSALDASDLNITDTGVSTDYATFEQDNLKPLISNVGSPSALGVEINQEANDQLAVRLGVSNRLDDFIDPILEISNNTATKYAVGFNFAENDGAGAVDATNNGYGANVKTDTTTYTDEDVSNNLVSRQLVQEIFQFELDGTDYFSRNDVFNGLADTTGASADGDLISPDPTSSNGGNPDEADTPVQLSGGETIFVKLDFNTNSGEVTTNITGKINSAAAGGSGTPWSSNSLVDLLDSVFVHAV